MSYCKKQMIKKTDNSTQNKTKKTKTCATRTAPDTAQ